MGCSREDLRQNLMDAGCSRVRAERILEQEACGNKRERDRELDALRALLLDRLHRETRRLACLDYLRDELAKEDSQG